MTATAHDELPHDLLLAKLEEAAHAALPSYGLDPRSGVVLLNHSENTTYRIDDPVRGTKVILRIHRIGYHSKNAIASELTWMEALRRQTPVRTPKPIAGVDGDLIGRIEIPGLTPRHCVLFEFLEGREPPESELVGAYRMLGEISARFHRQAEGWTLPAGFERLTWDFDHALGARPNWGDWREAPFLDVSGTRLLERLVAVVKQRLDRFGTSRARFGLVHADLRLANLLLHRDGIRVIDFDDSGFCWFLYDLAAALSFMEDRADVADLIDSWLGGYRTVRPLSDEEQAEIPTFLMLRRLLVAAWMGSHSETDLAKSLGPRYIQGSYRLAERYLSDLG